MGSSGNPWARKPLRAPATVFLALLCVSSAFVVADAACNCDGIQMTPAPVCGSNGVTYANACVATCQGIAIAAHTACDSASGPAPAAASPSGFAKTIVATATVSRATLNKYRAQGFSYVGRVRLETTKARMPTVVHTEEGKSNAALRQRTVMRIDYAGSEAEVYALPVPAGNASATAGGPLAASVEAQQVGAQPGHGRRLHRGNIVGADERVNADILPHMLPLSTVGYLSTGCTGALVGPRTVLTATHCMYNANTGAWNYGVIFVPNLHGGGMSHCHTGKHSRSCYKVLNVPVVNAFMLNLPTKCGSATSTCISSKDIPFDIAVLILAEDVRWYGSLGYKYDCSAKAQTTFTVSTAGYPSDQAPSYLFTNWYFPSPPSITVKQCPTGAKSAITSQLDIYPGQSGSPVWSADGKVRAVVSATSGTKSMLAPVDKEAFNFIKAFRQ